MRLSGESRTTGTMRLSGESRTTGTMRLSGESRTTGTMRLSGEPSPSRCDGATARRVRWEREPLSLPVVYLAAFSVSRQLPVSGGGVLAAAGSVLEFLQGFV